MRPAQPVGDRRLVFDVVGMLRYWGCSIGLLRFVMPRSHRLVLLASCCVGGSEIDEFVHGIDSVRHRVCRTSDDLSS